MNECVIVLMCDVSKLITEERHTHSNIHGWTPEHEIIMLACFFFLLAPRPSLAIGYRTRPVLTIFRYAGLKNPGKGSRSRSSSSSSSSSSSRFCLSVSLQHTHTHTLALPLAVAAAAAVVVVVQYTQEIGQQGT
jgi:hypothetical protein